MEMGIITLFPEMFDALNFGVIGRAIKQNIINLQFWNPRDFTTDKHRTVDDRPYGGGPGMLMKAQPLQDAIKTAKNKIKNAKVIYVSPQGQRFDQAAAKKMANNSGIIFLAGRYEGIDERLIGTDIDEEWSIGDYVLTGGELAIMVMVDAITRLLPNVLGDEESAAADSFMDGLLDHPHYTRPEILNGLAVPEVLLSGNHAEIAKWRLKQALGRTWLRRPDLLEKMQLNKLQKNLLKEFINSRKL
ncbi:MAG: tRNA (guanosine(37)-N1)-methyltransferase TrmD [Gammaproteobacteria bacterium]|jgi:tRNA (guanine37-N1)-methyltransferase